MAEVNCQCRLAARPVGLPTASDWDYVEEPAPEPLRTPADGPSGAAVPAEAEGPAESRPADQSDPA